MGSVENLDSQKKKILSFINVRGPNLPVPIANYLKIDSLIVSAFLSELLSEKELKMSSMKVGSSPIYYVKGQEFQLEKFANHLSKKEREAFEMLKDYGVLNDRKVPPPIRVALRSIKDFSFPVEYRGELYWRYLKLSDSQAIEILEKHKSENVGKKPLFEKIKEAVLPREEIVQKGINIDYAKPIEQGIKIQHRNIEFEEKPEEKSLDIKPKKKVGEKSDFVLNVGEFLKNNGIAISEEINFKKKEFNAKISVDSRLGKLVFFCIAKDKKSVNENDLNLALSKSQEEKMPVLILCPGELNKKAKLKMEELKGLVFFRKLV